MNDSDDNEHDNDVADSGESHDLPCCRTLRQDSRHKQSLQGPS